MRAGRLDRRVTIRRATVTTNALGEAVEAWGDLVTVWASKTDKVAGESTTARAREETGELRAATITTIFQVRWSATIAGVTPLDRLRLDGRDFDITGIREIGRREGREIVAVARAE